MTSQPIESDLVLGISPDNHLLHVGPAQLVIAHVLRAVVGEKPVQSPLEFYDIAGFRRSIHELSEMAGGDADPALLDAYDDAILRSSESDADSESAVRFGSDPDPRPGPDPEPAPDPDGEARQRQRRLLRRIYAALDFGQAYLTAHPEVGNQGPNVPPITDVPRPVGSYPEVLAELSREFEPWEPSHRANWFHNLWHAATGT